MLFFNGPVEILELVLSNNITVLIAVYVEAVIWLVKSGPTLPDDLDMAITINRAAGRAPRATAPQT